MSQSRTKNLVRFMPQALPRPGAGENIFFIITVIEKECNTNLHNTYFLDI